MAKCYQFEGYFATTDEEPEGYIACFAIDDPWIEWLIEGGANLVVEDETLNVMFPEQSDPYAQFEAVV